MQPQQINQQQQSRPPPRNRQNHNRSQPQQPIDSSEESGNVRVTALGNVIPIKKETPPMVMGSKEGPPKVGGVPITAPPTTIIQQQQQPPQLKKSIPSSQQHSGVVPSQQQQQPNRRKPQGSSPGLGREPTSSTQQQQQQPRQARSTPRGPPPPKQHQQQFPPPLPTVTSPQLNSAPPSISSSSSIPKLGKVNSLSSWGDDDNGEENDDNDIEKLRKKMEKLKTENLNLASKWNSGKIELSTAQSEATKAKDELEKNKKLLDAKLTECQSLESALNSVRKTRDSLEQERDALNRKVLSQTGSGSSSNIAAPPPSNSSDLNLQKRIQKLEAEVESQAAELEYYKALETEMTNEIATKTKRILELESSQSNNNTRGNRDSNVWILSSSSNSHREKIADSLGFSQLETSIVDVASWQSEEEFKKSIARLAQEKGEVLDMNSVNFETDAPQTFAKIFSQGETLIFVPKLDTVMYEKYLVNFVGIMFESQQKCGATIKNFKLVLEGYPRDFIILGDGNTQMTVSKCSL